MMDVEETIIERKDGVTVHMESKRGTDPRDQDKVSATVNAETVPEAREESLAALTILRTRMEQLREMQFDADDDNDQ